MDFGKMVNFMEPSEESNLPYLSPGSGPYRGDRVLRWGESR